MKKIVLFISCLVMGHLQAMSYKLDKGPYAGKKTIYLDQFFPDTTTLQNPEVAEIVNQRIACLQEKKSTSKNAKNDKYFDEVICTPIYKMKLVGENKICWVDPAWLEK